MKVLLASALLAASSMPGAQVGSWGETPQFIEGSITRAGGKEIFKIVKDSTTGKIVCLLGQNNFPIEKEKILSDYLNREGYSHTGEFYALRVGSTVGAILVSNDGKSMRILDKDGKQIAKFFTGAKGDKYSARKVVGDPGKCELED